jgi:hypothetical protein
MNEIRIMITHTEMRDGGREERSLDPCFARDPVPFQGLKTCYATTDIGPGERVLAALKTMSFGVLYQKS